MLWNFDTEKNIHIDTIDIFMILKSPTVSKKMYVMINSDQTRFFTNESQEFYQFKTRDTAFLSLLSLKML